MTLSSSTNATPDLMRDVLTHIKAELECAIIRIYNEDQQEGHPPQLTWLKKGVGRATIILTIDEKSLVDPTLIYVQNFPTWSQTFPNKSVVPSPRNFGLGSGASLSSDAQRTIQADYSFNFEHDFFGDPKIRNPTNLESICHPFSGFLIDSDLKIYDSFKAILYPDTLVPRTDYDEKFFTGTSNTMQTHIVFTLAASGYVTPAWKLVPVSYNVNSNPFFQATRNSTNDVLITIGKEPTEVATAQNITKIGAQFNIVIDGH
jgi:hypothetical protein